MKFKTKLAGIPQISLHNTDRLIEAEFKKKLLDTYDETAIIYWHLDIEAKEWGVKNMIVTIDKIELEFDWEDYDEQRQNYGFDNILGEKLGYELMDNSYTNLDSGVFTPKDIWIDFKTKEIEVIF